MAAAIPEIVETAGAAGNAAEGAGAARAGAARVPRGSRAAAAPQRRQQRQRQLSQSARRKGRGALKARLPGSHSYQPVILAEFLVAVVVVSVSPVAKGGTPEAQVKGSPSPYSTNTLKQLIAIGAVYFTLALLASSRRAGRYAAWFGGLVLLGLGFAELASGDLQAVFKIFGPSAGATPKSILGTSVTNPGAPADIGNAAGNALNPAAAFPTLEPGGTIVPAQASITPSSVTVPAGQSGVITTGLPPGVNLA